MPYTALVKDHQVDLTLLELLTKQISASGDVSVAGALYVTGASTLSGAVAAGAITAPSLTSTGVNIQSAAAIVAGTTQTRTGATAITTEIVSVTVGNASDGVVLPSAVVGAIIKIVNVSNAAGKIYAAGSDTVNLVAGATGVALPTGSTTGTVTFAVCASAASWTLK